jgi:hydroxymethylpyrimidine pyrophosphatase-like HAD family hydrolase
MTKTTLKLAFPFCSEGGTSFFWGELERLSQTTLNQARYDEILAVLEKAFPSEEPEPGLELGLDAVDTVVH